MCAELVPQRVTLDERGYPILDSSPLPPELVAHARHAADVCPTLPLLLEPEDR
jgi:ferredoxin